MMAVHFRAIAAAVVNSHAPASALGLPTLDSSHLAPQALAALVLWWGSYQTRLSSAPAMVSDGQEKMVYSMEEVGQHVAQDDCWMVINGKVYNLTTFMDDHPGGDDVLLQAAGRDATEEFEDVGHSKAAIEQMQDFYVGECPQVLEEKASPTVVEADLAIGGSATPASPTNSVGILSKIIQFLVPLVLLGVAVALRKYGKEEVKV